MKALVAYANGTEDLEATAVADVLSRGGVEVVRAAVAAGGATEVTLAHGTRVRLDANIEDCQGPYDAIIVPGGLPGAQHCHDSAALTRLLSAQRQRGALVAAICAAPGFVLAEHGLIGNARATCYPGCKDSLIPGLCPEGVVNDREHHIITGKGPWYALEFALEILGDLMGDAVRAQVEGGMRP
ncbi:MAG: DJ-1/PfpI family protein [Succinivibrionaceae bacterium]|nr:DJ-1/PfpI family protein [Succinivibrionaceae bacterium]